MKQLEAVKEEFVKTISASNTSLDTTTDSEGIVYDKLNVVLTLSVERIGGGTRAPAKVEYY